MFATVDAARVHRDSAEAHKQRFGPLRCDEAVLCGQRRIADQHHGLGVVAGEEVARSMIVGIEAAHLNRPSAGGEDDGGQEDIE